MEQLIHRIALRVTDEDYITLKHTASANNMTVSTYLRHLIKDALYNDKNSNPNTDREEEQEKA